MPDQSNLKWYAWRKLCFIKNSLKKLIYFSKWPIQSWSDRPVLTFEKHLKLPAQTKKIYLLIPDYRTVLSQALSQILSGRWLYDRLLTARIQNTIFIYGLGLFRNLATHSFLPMGTEEHTMYLLWGDIYLNPIHWANRLLSKTTRFLFYRWHHTVPDT